ncbi:Hypothetical predicted protein [Pelobates cultripes]|uniref:Uncharacterized protein n=1 Tax=Pelobates cultripes TaxID=61616 RepID=A0AAD1R6L7_PELCU|nr:Hypothetical predicted protein [Pelobates cultripes]
MRYGCAIGWLIDIKHGCGRTHCDSSREEEVSFTYQNSTAREVQITVCLKPFVGSGN